MKSFYLNLKNYNLCRLLLLAVVSFVGLSAAAETIDLGELELDKSYSIPKDKNYYVGHVTAPQSGVLTYSNYATSFYAYADADLTTELEGNWAGWDNGARVYSLNVIKGEVYYFAYGPSLDEGVFKVSMSNKLELKSTSVAEGASISAAGDGTIVYQFNQSIVVESVTLSSGSNSVALSLSSGQYRVSGASLVVNYSDVLKDWYESGAVVPGDNVQVSVTGLASALDAKVLYNGTGLLNAVYVAANKPVTLVSATTADGATELVNGSYASFKFLSYFTEDNPNGKYVFTFSDPLSTTLPANQDAFAYLIVGENSETYDPYKEALDVVFSNDNKTMTIDCTEKLRTLEDMLGSNPGGTMTVILRLQSLKSADGQSVYTGTNASQGTFSFPFYYEEATSSVGARFRPADTFGTSEQLTIQVTGYDQIKFNGIKFAWRAQGAAKEVVVDKEDLSISLVSTAATIKVTIPEEARTAKNVTVSFDGIKFNDGVDHSSVFTKLYNEGEYAVSENCEVETDPEDLSEVEELTDMLITFTGHSYVYYNEGTAYVSGRLMNAQPLPAPTASKLANRMNQSFGDLLTANDHYTVVFPQGYFIFEDNSVNAEFSVTVAVNKEQQQGPEVGALNITSTPANGSTVESCQSIDIIFNDYAEAGIGSGKATISKDGGEAVAINVDAEYGTAWNEVLQSLESALTPGTYVVTFPAAMFILDGDDSPEFSITFTIGAALNITSTPANGSTVASCESIDIFFNDYEEAGIGSGKATISKDGGEAVAINVDAEYGTAWNEVLQPLESALAEGTYVVTFPAAMFILDGDDSPKFSITFTVDASAAVSDITVVSDDEAQYFDIKGVKVNNPVRGGIYIVKHANKVEKQVLK
jgi:hypothetical protein